MRRHVIFTLTRPLKRRVHNNYRSFPTIDGGDGFERPKSPISQHLDALEIRTRSIHGRAQFYCGLGGHARAQHGHIVGRAQVERRRCRHPARNMFWPNPRRKNREGTSAHDSLSGQYLRYIIIIFYLALESPDPGPKAIGSPPASSGSSPAAAPTARSISKSSLRNGRSGSRVPSATTFAVLVSSRYA